MLYQYVGPYERVYPDILDPPRGSLVVAVGDVHEFAAPPDDRWIPVEPDDPVIKLAPAVAERGQE